MISIPRLSGGKTVLSWRTGPRVKRIILHVGPPKSGSTSIQSALRNSTEALGSNGVFYFRSPWEPTYALTTAYQDNPRKAPAMHLRFSTDDAARAWSEDHWGRLETLARCQEYECIVISSEHLFDLPQLRALFRRLAGLADCIDVVAYARDPVSWYVSRTDQLIRGGARFEDLQLPSQFTYRLRRKIERIERIERILEESRIIVRNFDRGNLCDGDVVSDFFSLIGDAIGRPVAPMVRFERNARMPGAVTAWLLRQNEDDRLAGAKDRATRLLMRRRLIGQVRTKAELRRFPPISMVDERLKQVLLFNARETLAWLNETYLKDQVQLPLIAGPAEPTDDEDIRARTRDWLLSYSTEETNAIMQALWDEAEAFVAEKAARKGKRTRKGRSRPGNP